MLSDLLIYPPNSRKTLDCHFNLGRMCIMDPDPYEGCDDVRPCEIYDLPIMWWVQRKKLLVSRNKGDIVSPLERKLNEEKTDPN